MATHPLRIKPLGNLYLCEDPQSVMEQRRHSLGFFAFFSEEILIQILSFLPESDLGTLSATSQYLCGYSTFDELWKDLFWQKSLSRGIEFGSSWKQSLSCFRSGKKRRIDNGVSLRNFSDPVLLPKVFSDLLHAPFRTWGLKRLAIENIERRSAELDIASFQTQFEVPNRPMILTKYIEAHWEDFPKTVSEIATMCDETVFSCGPVSMTIPQFQNYIDSGLYQVDESPYFVFDAWAFANCELKQKYTVPAIFQSDLFDLLSPPFRPDNAWLLIGPENAASKWHVDPNGTNAWNGVVSGSKRWLMLPPHLGPPPGVEMSSDSFAVRQPLHLRDWFDSFYQETVRLHGNKGLVECTCRAGEIVFVPRGWWHCVINLETTIAVTQNYAAKSSLSHVRSFLKKFPHCVSGIEPPELRPELGKRFDAVLLANNLIADEPIEEEEGGSFWGNFGSKSIGFARS